MMVNKCHFELIIMVMQKAQASNRKRYYIQAKQLLLNLLKTADNQKALVKVHLGFLHNQANN
jgi:hypothetical protein